MLRPWQPLPALNCEYCPALVTKRVYGDSWDDFVKGTDGVLRIISNSHESVLTCDQHSEEASARICDELGSACSEPLRMAWQYWLLYVFGPLRWIGRIEVAIHNWRFDRMAARVARCHHDIDPQYNACRNCGCQFLN